MNGKMNYFKDINTSSQAYRTSKWLPKSKWLDVKAQGSTFYSENVIRISYYLPVTTTIQINIMKIISFAKFNAL